MGKAPAFQWYPGDWFREPGLKMVDLDVRGAWVEILMVMWDSNPKGVMDTSIDGLAKLLRIDPERSCHILYDLDIYCIADVLYIDTEVEDAIAKIAVDKKLTRSGENFQEESGYSSYYFRIISRRMFREWKDKEYDRLRKRRIRYSEQYPKNFPYDFPENLRLPSSSSSSSNKRLGGSVQATQPKENEIKERTGTNPPESFELVAYGTTGQPSFTTNTQSSFFQDLLRTFPKLDIAQELRVMSKWLHDNKHRKEARKTLRGMNKFITNWLKRSQKDLPNEKTSVSQDNRVEDTSRYIESTFTCEECGGFKEHLESCSEYIEPGARLRDVTDQSGGRAGKVDTTELPDGDTDNEGGGDRLSKSAGSETAAAIPTIESFKKQLRTEGKSEEEIERIVTNYTEKKNGKSHDEDLFGKALQNAAGNKG